jgi:hypothetical protein
VSDASAKRWATRRERYGAAGHGSSYSRWTKDPYGVRALQWVVEMHLEGTLSEGQCCQRLDMDRIDFRMLVDRPTLTPKET